MRALTADRYATRRVRIASLGEPGSPTVADIALLMRSRSRKDRVQQGGAPSDGVRERGGWVIASDLGPGGVSGAAGGDDPGA